MFLQPPAMILRLKPIFSVAILNRESAKPPISTPSPERDKTDTAMNPCKSRPLFFVWLSLFFLPLSAAWASHESFQEYMDTELAQFRTYQDALDAEFSNYLKKEWQAFQVHRGEKRDTTPKPVAIPTAPAPRPPKENPTAQIPAAPAAPQIKPERPTPPAAPAIVPPIPRPEPNPVISLPAPEPVPEKADKAPHLSFRFFATPITLPRPNPLPHLPGSGITDRDVARFFDEISKENQPAFREAMADTARKLALDDWGLHLFFFTVATQGMGAKTDAALLFTWYQSLKSGFNARIGITKGHVRLLVQTDRKLFSTPFLPTRSGPKFYHLALTPAAATFTTLQTYKGKYPGKRRPLRIQSETPPLLAPAPVSRRVSFAWEDTNHTLPLSFDRNLISYAALRPQTELPVYLAMDVSHTTAKGLDAAFFPLLKNRSDQEKIGLLLRFVQTAFAYKTDENQFGKETYMGPEETLAYPFSDCEDRTALFTWLVRRYTTLPVVALLYPGHVAAAVQFPDPVKGDGFLFHGNTFTICDPTYIRAEIGMTMPRFQTVTPEILPIFPETGAKR